jgi:hypothetical protein
MAKVNRFDSIFITGPLIFYLFEAFRWRHPYFEMAKSEERGSPYNIDRISDIKSIVQASNPMEKWRNGGSYLSISGDTNHEHGKGQSI